MLSNGQGIAVNVPVKILVQNQNPICVAREGSACITEPDQSDTGQDSTITLLEAISEGPAGSRILTQTGIPLFKEPFASAWDSYKPGAVGGYRCVVTNANYYTGEGFHRATGTAVGP